MNSYTHSYAHTVTHKHTINIHTHHILEPAAGTVVVVVAGGSQCWLQVPLHTAGWQLLGPELSAGCSLQWEQVAWHQCPGELGPLDDSVGK